jgi:ABC-2 type transport system ATP-binding protein
MSEQGVTVFVSTHYMEEAEYCNRIALIFRGKIVALGSPAELKQKHMKGELLELECAPLSRAIEVLKPGGNIFDVAIFGSGLHVVAQDAQAAIPGIRATLEQNGIAVDKIEQVRASLEDVFVSLTGSGTKDTREVRQ